MLGESKFALRVNVGSNNEDASAFVRRSNISCRKRDR
jgi:hypothetical protein